MYKTQQQKRSKPATKELEQQKQMHTYGNLGQIASRKEKETYSDFKLKMFVTTIYIILVETTL